MFWPYNVFIRCMYKNNYKIMYNATKIMNKIEVTFFHKNVRSLRIFFDVFNVILAETWNNLLLKYAKNLFKNGMPF